jgi:type IV pilus assembly protein PilV
MLSLALFAVGVTGIIAMQKVTVVSNQHAKNLALATSIAEAWLDQLSTDTTVWTTDLTKTTWASVGVEESTNGQWFLPAHSEARAFGRAFDALGAPIPDDQAEAASFCTQVRLTNLYSAAGGNGRLAGNGLIRAEVRVFWLRDGGTPVAGACTESNTAAAVGASTSYHRVYKITAIRQHATAK